LVGAFANDQVGYHRPFAGAGNYRTHLGGLYLCGASSHPGGNITGLPAYNAAQVILSDLGLAADWMPTPIAAQLAGGERCFKRIADSLDHLAVVPAKAGTHIPEPVVMGPRLRGDDSNKFAAKMARDSERAQSVMGETVAAIVEAHRSGAANPEATVARAYA